MDKPTFVHDCDGCTFLGVYQKDSSHYDLYFCGQSVDLSTVIARYASEGSRYLSGLEVARAIKARNEEGDSDHPLVVAMDRAMAAGHITEEEAKRNER